MVYFVIILLVLTLATAIVVPLLLYRRLLKVQQAERSQIISSLDRHLGAVVKLLEVRDYYEETSKALGKMLDEAYKEGNRFRQDQIRKLVNRLEAMKVRTFDKQVRILDSTPRPAKKRRRHKSRRSKDKLPSKSQPKVADGKPENKKA